MRELVAAPPPGDPFPFAPRLGGLGLADDPGEESGDDPRLDVRALTGNKSIDRQAVLRHDCLQHGTHARNAAMLAA